MNVVYDIAAVAVCTGILAVSAWLNWRAGTHLEDARRHLDEARALIEREDRPPRWLHVVDGGGPQ